MQVLHTSCVVVGSGIAGLSAALGHGDAVVVSKTTLGDGSSRWAQGGIAAALGPDDGPERHASDTVAVSGGLGRDDIAAVVTAAAPERIAWLRGLGAAFDQRADADGGPAFALGREAGHSRHRIVHANGDATGAEVMRTLVAAVRERDDITCLDHTFVLDLLLDGDRVAGVLAVDGSAHRIAIVAPSVVLATGGIGRLYRFTTNPHEVTGDGLAMALRAGVAVRDPEFVQFHPTAMRSDLDPMPLLTEALRGEGAHLVTGDGHRFMVDAHDDAELAPRDIVARHIFWQRQEHEVFLDARSIGDDFPTRFPTVWEITRQVGLDPRIDLLPVSAAEHYHMGGIATDAHGRTSAPGLYAAGEAASTGLHGANRLASNSLLEGLVFGARVAETATIEGTPRRELPSLRLPASSARVDMTRRSENDSAIVALREAMWEHVGLVRDDAGLATAQDTIECLAPALASHPIGRNLVTVATAVTGAARARRESRGSHYRRDFPNLGEHASHTHWRPVPEPMRDLAIDRQLLDAVREEATT